MILSRPSAHSHEAVYYSLFSRLISLTRAQRIVTSYYPKTILSCWSVENPFACGGKFDRFHEQRGMFGHCLVIGLRLPHSRSITMLNRTCGHKTLQLSPITAHSAASRWRNRWTAATTRDWPRRWLELKECVVSIAGISDGDMTRAIVSPALPPTVASRVHGSIY